VDRDRIREIIRLAQESPIAELRVREGDLEVRVLKAAPAAAHAGTSEGQAPFGTALVPASDTLTVRATKVGFFHRGRGPSAPPLVEVGDHVPAGQALANLESLRKLTDVTADVAGEVTKVLVEDGSAVEYGQPLFEIRPEPGGGSP
jgi:acetyl-CoA carboxylase biotin carboxyl carrier protein